MKEGCTRKIKVDYRHTPIKGNKNPVTQVFYLNILCTKW